MVVPDVVFQRKWIEPRKGHPALFQPFLNLRNDFTNRLGLTDKQVAVLWPPFIFDEKFDLAIAGRKLLLCYADVVDRFHIPCDLTEANVGMLFLLTNTCW